MTTQKLEEAGYRCMECGKLDPQSNLPCTEHGDVEKVYRLVDEETPIAQHRESRG
jgi:hypothetical protein